MLNFLIITILGYGRSENEANINCIRNLLEILLEDENTALVFKDCLKKGKIIDD